LSFRLLGVWLCAQVPQEKIRSLARLEDFLVVIILLLVMAGIIWFAAAYSRKKQMARREQHLKSYILEDPRWRDIYFRARKENNQGSEK